MLSLTKKVIDSGKFKYSCNDSVNWRKLCEIAYELRTDEQTLEFSNVLDELSKLLEEDYFYNLWKSN